MSEIRIPDRLPDTAYQLPRVMTPAIREVLRIPNFRCHDIARVLEHSGVSMLRKAEDEQAVTLFFLLPYAIAFADDWWTRAHADLMAMIKSEQGGKP